jgi:UDP-glucose 4-epimerase
VVDLARGHISALRKLAEKPGLITHNLGTGRGHSVLEVVRAFETVVGQPMPYRMSQRRAGDAPAIYADSTRAANELGWIAGFGIEAMCRDAFNWQHRNPRGYP